MTEAQFALATPTRRIGRRAADAGARARAEDGRARARFLLRRLPCAEEHQPRHRREARDRADRPVRLRQVDAAAHVQPHLLDLSEARRQGRGAARRREHPRPEVSAEPAAQQGRHGVPEAGAVSDVDLRQHRLRHPPLRETARAPTWTAASSRRCARRALWDEVEGQAQAERARPFRRPAAAPVHRARGRAETRSDPARRTDLGARSDRHRQDRAAVAELKQRLHDRDRHPQHAAGRARAPTSPRSCTSAS